MTAAIAGPGFLLSKGDGAVPENFTTVAEVRDIKGPVLSTDLHDVTNQSSPGGYEEFVPTIRRTGEVTFPVNYQPSDPTHNATTGLLGDLNNKTLRNWRLGTLDPGGKRWNFAGYVVKLETDEPVAGVLTGTIAIKVTGQPTLA